MSNLLKLPPLSPLHDARPERFIGFPGPSGSRFASSPEVSEKGLEEAPQPSSHTDVIPHDDEHAVMKEAETEDEPGNGDGSVCREAGCEVGDDDGVMMGGQPAPDHVMISAGFTKLRIWWLCTGDTPASECCAPCHPELENACQIPPMILTASGTWMRTSCAGCELLFSQCPLEGAEYLQEDGIWLPVVPAQSFESDIRESNSGQLPTNATITVSPAGDQQNEGPSSARLSADASRAPSAPSPLPRPEEEIQPPTEPHPISLVGASVDDEPMYDEDEAHGNADIIRRSPLVPSSPLSSATSQPSRIPTPAPPICGLESSVPPPRNEQLLAALHAAYQATLDWEFGVVTRDLEKDEFSSPDQRRARIYRYRDRVKDISFDISKASLSYRLRQPVSPPLE